MAQALPQHIKYLDLFNGTGGFALGLQQAGFVFKKHYCSEIDKYAAANYKYNFPASIQLGDISGIGEDQIEAPDLISFGSPCQDVSIAGKRKGIKGKRSRLFFEALRLIRIYRPRVFIFENVKGLFSSNQGKDFEAVLRAFADIGLYDLQWQLVNTAWLLPQNRERIYIVGHLRGTARPEIFPLEKGIKAVAASGAPGIYSENIASAITSSYRKGPSGRGETFVRAAYKIPEATKKGYAIAQEGDSVNLLYMGSSERRGRVVKGAAHTLTAGGQQHVVHKGDIRRLTPIECERLQGFPDNWTRYGLLGDEQQEISDTQRYTMLGNAVSVVAVQSVAERLRHGKNELGTTGIGYVRKQQPEIVTGSAAEINVPEIDIIYTRQQRPFLGHTTNSGQVAAFLRTTFNHGAIELQEYFVVLYLNSAKEIIGYYRHTRGAINATSVDTRIILATALKCLATGIILCHNHPSGNYQPSEDDKKTTTKIKEAATQLDIRLYDHVIVTVRHHFSFADNGLTGVEGLANNRERDFVVMVQQDLQSKVKHNKRSLETLAQGYGIKEKNEVKELTELAIVNAARSIAQTDYLSIEQKFSRIVELYEHQVNLSHRTSQSILLQQYSTPAPIGYLMGIFCGLDQLHKDRGYAFEPSAGNGLLTIAARPSRVYVNEIDPVRRKNLDTQGFKAVWDRDATEAFYDLERSFMAVLTNPPFGLMDRKVKFKDYQIEQLEHVMALRALDCMANAGKAAIIIGAHTHWDEKGRIQTGKNRLFFNYLYHYYHVSDVIQIDGKKLYSRQGTSFNTRLILIDGRKVQPGGAAPIYDKERDAIVSSFGALLERVMEAAKLPEAVLTPPAEPDKKVLMKQEAKRLYAALLALSGIAGGHTIVKSSDLLEGAHLDDDQIVDHDALFEQFLQKKEEDPTALYLFETPETFAAFNEDAEIISRVCKVGIIKASKDGEFQYFITGLSKSMMFLRTAQLEEAGYKPVMVENPRYHTQRLKDKVDQEMYKILTIIARHKDDELGSPYEPSSNACVILDTQVPDAMAFETGQALEQIREAVGGDADNFVRDRLGYPTKSALCRALSAEQTDAVMMAIYNIEAREQGMIIGDQTGIGKGRVAAAMIRYACLQGMQPVFITEKANLFSDLYRDLLAIGSGRLKPFIINGQESKTDIKDEDGNIVYQALIPAEQQKIFRSGALPPSFDFALATYSQFNSPETKPDKPYFLQSITQGNILILDEAHNSSGDSNTGRFMRGVVSQTKGVVFLSATFAKRADNMPLYARKTAISDCNMSQGELVESIFRGGIALQEVLSSQLVSEGQMIRRERSYEGIEVNYITLTEKAQEHQAIADNITSIIRDIIRFQEEYVDYLVKELDEIAVFAGKQIDTREGVTRAGVDNTPYFSKVFNIINQMLFAIKASSVADLAIERLREGKKPIIACASTMGSFLENMEDEKGLPVSDGSIINADFSEVLLRGLDGVLRYTERETNGAPVFKRFGVEELSPTAQIAYDRIRQRIVKVSTGISISPIDIVLEKIRAAGYSVAEVTGRKYELQLHDNGYGLVLLRKKINTNDAFRQFNNNEIDVLLINQAGSTGASAHAIPTLKVPKEQVKQRVMIVLQAELDINTEVQKRGRINRTGQIMKPVYDYVASAIPAETRLMMLLQKKLKSLDANTASNQKQSVKILDVPDFLNKYGDRVVWEYLQEHPDINQALGDLLDANRSEEQEGDAPIAPPAAKEFIAHKVSGRVAVLSVKMQQEFYSEIAERYADYVSYLKEVGEYDLEMEAMNLEAETLDSKIVKMGTGSGSVFSEDSILETVEVNVLKKPFTTNELDNLLTEALKGEDPKELQRELIKDYEEEAGMSHQIDMQQLRERYQKMKAGIYQEKKYQRLETDGEREDYVLAREGEIEGMEEKALENLQRRAASRSYHMKKIFSFFYIGRNLQYPIGVIDGYKEYVPTVFVGFMIDWQKKDPFLPSRVKLRFALASSSKYFAVPASFDAISNIIAASNDLPELSREDILLNWAGYIKDNTRDRKTRHILTGNLLQAFSAYRGKLVSYTTKDGKVNKGILMPESWVQKEDKEDKVGIPVMQALPLIRSLVKDKSIVTSTGIGFLRKDDHYKIIVPMSRREGGDIYLDKQLLALVEGNNFQSTADKMTAILPLNNISGFVGIIQDRHNCSVEINRQQFNQLEKGFMRMKQRKPIRLPGPEQPATDDNRIRLLKLKAQALNLRLRLLAA